MDIIGSRFSTLKLRDFHLFHVCPSFINCPSARRAIVTVSDRFIVGIFIKQIINSVLIVLLILYQNLS